ncbi:unnamed protein product [Didymodactylos carnosus]|nr:unnamed protein product [Didymodactylos carnosus]CAF4406037.1 unnamed protein product [Didymodactylos carnosus]
MPSGTVYLSKPHFYGHNSSQFNINGFSPEREKHESMIYFEPYSGTPVKAHHRIQLNVNAFVDTFKYRGGEWRPSMNARVSKRILPLLWIDQEITLNTTALGQLQYVHRMVKILNIARFVALAVAIVIPIILIVAMELRSKSVAGKRRNGDPDFKKQPVLLRTRI